jgi:hypothetical protein
MRPPRRGNRPLVVALYLNAALLLSILVALLAGGRGPSFLPAAFAQLNESPAPIAGGGGVYVMPAQFTQNQWGCYVLDVPAQTLCAYQWFGDKKFRLVAARSFEHDRQLHDFNTDNPTPAEVKKLVELEKSGRRDREPDRPPETQLEPPLEPQPEPQPEPETPPQPDVPDALDAPGPAEPDASEQPGPADPP